VRFGECGEGVGPGAALVGAAAFRAGVHLMARNGGESSERRDYQSPSPVWTTIRGFGVAPRHREGSR
jgi:hypothetical protein